MQPDNQLFYYIVVDEKSTGPFTLEDVILNARLTPDTLVWKPGLDNWVAAKTLPELEVAFRNNNPYSQPPQYQAPNPNYNNPDYGNPNSQTAEQEQPNRFANNPQYQDNNSYRNNPYHQDNHHYQNRPPYGHHHNDYYNDGNRYNNNFPRIHTNWLPWAIVATIVGFFASCIGVIFGIIGIVQANKANNLYARGYDREGDAANSNAKVMTIIGLIFAALGIVAAYFFGNFFANLSDLSYL